MKKLFPLFFATVALAFSCKTTSPNKDSNTGGTDIAVADTTLGDLAPNADAPKETFPGTNPGNGTIYYVGPAGNDSNAGTQAAPWKTLQHAADNIKAGDMVAILAGSYSSGFELTTSGTEQKPITFRGESKDKVTVSGRAGDSEDTIFVNEASNINIEQLSVKNSPRAGLRLSYAHKVNVRSSIFANNYKWGIFTDFSDDTLIEFCQTYGSQDEHGIYISNSSDRAIIRHNISYGNNGCGIQINADPSCGGDGISSSCILDSNVIYNNGNGGGSAINLASVRDSIISNNIIYANQAGGIAAWDDDQGEKWGSQNLTIINNTLSFAPDQGRWAISLKNGCTNATIQNNIVLPGAKGGIEFDNDSKSGMKADFNVFDTGHPIATNEDTEEWITELSEWQSAGNGANSLRSTAAALFENATGGDFHLKAGAPAIDKGTQVKLNFEFEGDPRPIGGKFDIGADEKK
ncbi:MAG: right-handed parallel beta-helix repeat-containing protein [Pseudomonadota bacterium]